MRTTITPPPNGPRNPPRYRAARARRSRTHRVGTSGRHGRRTGSQTSGGPHRSATVQAPRPAHEAGDVLVGHSGRRVGRDEQRRRAPRGGPGVAGVVEGIVDPRRRTVTRMTVDGVELPVSGPGWRGEGEKRRPNGQT